MKEYKTHSYEETVKLGERVAKSLPKGSVVAFLGGLGMGKTAFTTGFAKGLGIDVDVSSPTFAICNTYIGEENTLYHLICIVLTVGMTFIQPDFLIFLKPMHIWRLSGVKMFTALCLKIR